MQRIVAQLPWRHNIVLMSKLKDNNLRKKYAEATIKRSIRKLPTEEDLNLHIDINE